MDIVPKSKDENLGAAGAAATTKRILSEIAALGGHFNDCETTVQKDDWLSNVNEMFEFCKGVEDGSLKGQAALLINLQSYWPDLPLKFRKAWNDNFWFFAETKTGKDQGTLENHMRAVRVFMIGKKAPAGTVAIPVRDATGVPVKDSANAPTMQYVPWDPVNVPISKLVAIAARANADQMTPRLWSIAADPGGTWTQLQMALSETNSGGGGGSDDFDMNFYLAGSLLFVKEGQVEAYVGDIGLPYDDDVNLTSSDSLRERALRRMFTLLDIKKESDTANEALARMGLTIYSKDDIDKNEQA